MQLIIISDIHGNVSALTSVLEDIRARHNPNAIALLGDFIDYGMRSNKVIEIIRAINYPILCNIWGNHEKAVINEDYNRFSSKRGVESAKHTRRELAEDSLLYLNEVEGKSGFQEFTFCNQTYLAIHGSLEDPYWKAISPDSNLHGYEKYDYVLSGHSHHPHVFSAFYSAEDPALRNKKRTVFINPGSVGQPRNHDPRAQYAVLDSEKGIALCSVDYDIEFEQSLFTEEIDMFYRDRLSRGI